MLIQMIIIQVVTFLTIVFVLRKLLYSESSKEIVKLRQLKEETSLKQKELQQKIEAAESAYRMKITEAEDKIRLLSVKSGEEAEELRKEMLSGAKAEAEGIVKSALNTKEKIREEISIEMHKKVPVIALRIFKEILSPGVREMAHKELIRDVINKIKNTEKTVFKFKVDKGEIVSAYPLSKGDKQEIVELIHVSLGYEVPLHETEDSKLIAGIVIKLGTILIDGSLDSRLKQVEIRLGT
jgi:F-type H+-transporting ATPase subunit b